MFPFLSQNCYINVNYINSASTSSINHCQRGKQKRSTFRVFRLSRIHQDLKSLKNKIVKNIQGIRGIQRSSKNYQCVVSRQPQVCLSPKEAKQESSECDSRNTDITRYTELGKELSNSSNTSFLLDASTQALIIPCSDEQDDDNESPNRDYLPCQNLLENSVQTNAHQRSLAISDDRSATCPNRSMCGSSRNRVKRTLLSRKKMKKYKKCSCGEHCPYALHKLPCNEYRCVTSERKVDDGIGELTLECLSFKERNNFPKFISIDSIVHGKSDKCDKRSADVLSFEIGPGGSSISSVDLEVDVCSDHCHLENEPLNRRTRTYIVNGTSSRKDGELVANASTQDEPFLSTVSSWRNLSGERQKIDEAVEVSQ